MEPDHIVGSHVQTPGLVQLPPFKHDGLHTGVPQSVPFHSAVHYNIIVNII